MRTLILVDIQNDFLPPGALPVQRGDEVIAVANRILSKFDLVIASQDWHPANHGSFAANQPGRAPGDIIDLHGLSQVLWPVHCIQDTRGADFAPGLDISRVHVFRKGTDAQIDSYSAFFDNGRRKSTGLGDFLKERGVRHIHAMGLATDYCVKATALDARFLGLDVTLIADGCRAVNLKPSDESNALAEMQAARVAIATSGDV